ncbi:RICIN domain-containing protein [Mucilaginibacter pedocola]|uniref:Ricin B lectin domain-containing protein n=1 Tax=Mucilaginibacter pedocola TaxID=1792845 RepID=A0A1S9PL86_9SPHI|nr:hypothetical protein [Mucilaginibacter pedocola]OOQ61707.1 hypothetical protein BC343_01130 [Mucilaginibacter pedocola]
MKKLLLFAALFCAKAAFAQSPFYPVTESEPVTVNGLRAGYTITEESVKEVGSKGDFSRYKIKFYVTNTTPEARILYRRAGLFNSAGSANSVAALFKCANATGARFTNKQQTLYMQPCQILAGVEDKDCATGKTVKNTRFVDLGYWIKPGETISGGGIMIVPLNQKPVMSVTFYPEIGSDQGTFVTPPAEERQPEQTGMGLARVKNYSNSNYLHIQYGPVACTNIDFNWWSAQWDILYVPGTNYVRIRNRWKNSFISTDNMDLISEDGRSQRSMWVLEETGSNGTYFIKNAEDNAKLLIRNGKLAIETGNNTNYNAQWLIEKL